MNRREFLYACACCAAAGLGAPLPLAGEASAFAPVRGFMRPRPSPYFESVGGGDVQCTLCPRTCLIGEGERGYCKVRENRGGELQTLVYGNPCAVHVDPIEKKPFFHVLPTTSSFSIATAGCNFDCKFCQNWEISQARPDDTLNFDLPPAAVAELAQKYGCRSIASTYVEPSIFLEYMLDVGREAKKRGVLNLEHSNGFLGERALLDLSEHLDAACIDLKGFTEDYYRDVTEGELAPVLETLARLRRADIHIELVTLVLPGLNDGEADIRAMSRWVRDELGAETPLHFTRFYPRYKLKGLQPTPVPTLERAREAAMDEGLAFVYIGNVPGNPAENTFCPKCGAELIKRKGYRVSFGPFKDGVCLACGCGIPGIWA